MVCNGGKLYVFVHRQNIQILTKNDLPDKIKMPSDGGGALRIQRVVGHSSMRGGDEMPMTFTFHWYGFTITIRVKRDSRHPAR